MATTLGQKALPYHVQTTEAKVLPNFDAFPNQKGVSGLWSGKWKFNASRSIYPFMDGKIEDFEPIFAKLEELEKTKPRILYDPDAYAGPFLPIAESLHQQAEAAEEAGSTAKALELYLRECAVYRISRFPIVRTPLGRDIWAKQKATYAQAGKYLKPPSTEITIPFKHVDVARGDNDAPIQANLRIPDNPLSSSGHPVLLFITGLDAYRIDNTPRTQAHVSQGFAVLCFEIPGTGDNPGCRSDPESPDRVLSSVLAWVHENATKFSFDVNKICARGISTGGYYAMRAAHTHSSSLIAAVSQGGGAHHMFDEEWILNQDSMEYPFALSEALAYKFGYDDVKAYAKDSNARKRFSLIDGEISKVVDKDSCKMLIINGMEDSIFPVEDSILVAMHGFGKKDLIIRAGLRHMGNPGGEEILLDWLNQILAGKR